MNFTDLENSARKEYGGCVSAFVRQDSEGFHITLEFENSETGVKVSRPGLIAHDETSARQFIASEIANYGFDSGDCHIAWERL